MEERLSEMGPITDDTEMVKQQIEDLNVSKKEQFFWVMLILKLGFLVCIDIEWNINHVKYAMLCL